MYLTCGSGMRTIFYCKLLLIRYHWMITIPLRIFSDFRLEQRFRTTCLNSVESPTCPLIFWHNWLGVSWVFLLEVPYGPDTSLLCESRDNSDSTSEPETSSSPPSSKSLTHVHRSIGYHNPTCHSMTTYARLMYFKRCQWGSKHWSSFWDHHVWTSSTVYCVVKYVPMSWWHKSPRIVWTLLREKW